MEKTKLCKHCKTEIDAKAKICPNCKKKQGGILKFILIAIVVIIVIAAVSGGNGDSEQTTTNQNENTETEQNNTVNENAVNETGEVKNSFAVGEIAENDNFKITYLSAEEFVSDNEFTQPKDGYTYYKVGFEIENKASYDMIVTDFDFKGYADGYAVDQSYYFSEESITATLSTGKKVKGYVFYEVPKDAASITIEYETSLWTNEKITFVVK